MKRWFLLIEGALCGVYLNREDAESDYQKAKKDYPYADQLVELAETIETAGSDKTVNLEKTTSYKEWLSRIKYFLMDERSGISIKREKREKREED